MSENPDRDVADLGDELGDWRLRFVERIMRHGNPARMSAFGELQAPTGETFKFTDFMPPAIYPNLAMTAEAQANDLRPLIVPEQFNTRSGPETLLRDENLGTLFDYIEQSALSAIMSFLALEAYANFVIHFELGDGQHVFRCPRQPKQEFSAEEIERCGETLEKLKTIVPHLLKVDPPTKEPFWMKLWDMKLVRDSLVHLKFKDQMGAAKRAASSNEAVRTDPESVFYNLVSGVHKDFPRTAVETLDYFTSPKGTPRWLRYPLGVCGMTPTAAKGTVTVTLGPPIR